MAYVAPHAEAQAHFSDHGHRCSSLPHGARPEVGQSQDPTASGAMPASMREIGGVLVQSSGKLFGRQNELLKQKCQVVFPVVVFRMVEIPANI